MRRTPFYNFFIVALLVTMTASVSAQQVDSKLPWSVRLTESEMIRYPESWQLDFQPKLKWDYCHGLELGAMLDVYDAYGDKKISDYAIAYADTMVHEDGSITAYKLTDYSLDRINSGKILFRIYEQTKNPKYKKALDLLYSQFEGQPRNEDGGFWHKKIYPHQMWLDGIYMGAPFYAEYAFRNNLPQDYADVINQFVTCARHTYDPKNGLYRHACDVSRTQRWADPVTGQSKHTWGRAMGWYAMALVDVLEFIPQHEAGRDSLLDILNNVAVQVKKLQDPKTGGWYQVMDRSGDKGNYVESSCSAMFIYVVFDVITYVVIGAKSWLNTTMPIVVSCLIFMQLATGLWEELTFRAFVCEGYYQGANATFKRRLLYAGISMVIFGIAHAVECDSLEHLSISLQTYF